MTKDYKFFHGGIGNEQALMELQTIMQHNDLPALYKRNNGAERACYAMLDFPCICIGLMVNALDSGIYGEYVIFTWDGWHWNERDEIENVLSNINWEAEDIEEEVENKMWNAIIQYACENKMNFYAANE